MGSMYVLVSWLSLTQAPTALNRAALREQALRVAEQEDIFQACALLEVGDRPSDIAEDYALLVGEVYRQQRHIPRMLAFGQAGLSFCLREARRLRDTQPQRAAALSLQAQTIAYNLATNTWPGWNEPGVTLTTTDLAFGREAARLNLRLAQELARDAETQGQAHWLLGAHDLARQAWADAEQAFRQAEQQFAQAHKHELVLLARGYRALALRGQPAQRATGNALWQKTLQELTASSQPAAAVYADQVRTAERLFLPPP